MDYEKKYKKALDRARIWKYKSGMPKDRQGILDDIFPDLKDSEGESIKADLIQWINEFPDTIWRGHYKKDVIAWLEKQGEQKSVDYENINLQPNEFASKVEPKFKVGDWIVDKESKEVFHIEKKLVNTTEIVDVEGDDYHVPNYILEEDYDVWTIQDAKDGDILAVENRPFIYNGEGNPLSVGGYCGITNNGILKIHEESPGYGPQGWTMFDGDIYPATKEQRDTLKKAMAGAGWEFDFEKKVLNRIEKMSADNIKPKFKVGDWVVQGRNILKIRCVGAEYYCFETVGGYIDNMLVSEIDSLYHLWTNKDAKDGDVLASKSSVFIFQEEYIAEKPIAYCGIMNGRFIKGEDVCWTNERYYPATNEQRGTLMKAMADAGWEFDFRKKELKKIEDDTTIAIKNKEAYKIGFSDGKAHAKEEMTSMWSEEDEYIIEEIEALIDVYVLEENNPKALIDWLKSIKDKVQPQSKQEWSEEDEKMCQETIDWFEKKCFPYALENENPARESIKWLNSLRYKKQWKPSEEQMSALDSMLQYGRVSHNSFSHLHLNSLFNDLKKLREE